MYTGRLVGGLLHGQAKAEAILALAEREGLDLSRSSAYSDSANDLPMLELVGHPNVVNPGRGPAQAGRSRDWPVHEFRSGRKATLIALPVAAGAGAVAGGMAAGVALRRRRAGLASRRPGRALSTSSSSLAWIVSLTWPASSRHSPVVRLPARRDGQPAGLDRTSQNSMIQFDGSGTAPSGPSHGKSGVSGKYGSRRARASGSEFPSIG